jgi:hypothetical protein
MEVHLRIADILSVIAEKLRLRRHTPNLKQPMMSHGGAIRGPKIFHHACTYGAPPAAVYIIR